MDFSNVNPVQRPENAASVRRQSRSNQRRHSDQRSPLNEVPEKEPLAESGNDLLENDQYDVISDTESAILSEVTAAELKWPGLAAAHVLRLREENHGHHG